jgi:hypothetical protein
MLKCTDAAEVQTPLLAWKRRFAEADDPQRSVTDGTSPKI